MWIIIIVYFWFNLNCFNSDKYCSQKQIFNRFCKIKEETYDFVAPSIKVRSHNALKYNALVITALVDAGSTSEIISLIFPCVFSLTQLKKNLKKNHKPDEINNFMVFNLFKIVVNEPINVFRR